MNNKSITVWAAVNRNGKVVMFTGQPVRNENLGRWEHKSPFVNSDFYNQLSDLFKKANMNWERDPEFFEIQF